MPFSHLISRRSMTQAGWKSALEDTVLFPSFRALVGANEYDEPNDEFEKKEHELPGKEGFEGMVGRVTAIEKSLGIYDRALFTSKV